MDDLISRQAAIDCLGFTWPEDAIRNLPSAQPEPCEDAVSRAEAKKILYDFAGHIVDTPNGIYQQAYKTYMSKMDKLPSVTPKQRTGKWIKCGWAIKCSECDYDMPFTVRNFCPNCGAKMDGRRTE